MTRGQAESIVMSGKTLIASSKEHRGCCALCEALAGAWGVRGFGGYVDACHQHAHDMLVESLQTGHMEPRPGASGERLFTKGRQELLSGLLRAAILAATLYGDDSVSVPVAGNPGVFHCLTYFDAQRLADYLTDRAARALHS